MFIWRNITKKRSKQMDISEHSIIQPSNEINPTLDCRFEEAPPYADWVFCRNSCFHLKKHPISFLHYHLEMEIGYCVSGEGTLYLGNQTIPYQAGDVQIILPLQAHYDVSTVDETVWHFVSFLPNALRSDHVMPDPAFLEHLSANSHTCGVFPSDRFPALAQSVIAVTEFSLRPAKTPFDHDCLLVRLLNFLNQLAYTDRDRREAPDQSVLNANKILPALIGFSKALEAGKCLTISEMAELCHFSPSYFRKLFTEQMGKHPKQYILSEQLKRAKQLLITTDLPVSKIQQLTGFSDSSVFFRNFTARYHCSPSAYRTANQESTKIAFPPSAPQ